MWSSGDQIVMRYLNDRRISFARPVTVVEDTDERVVLYLAARTPTKRRVRLDGTPIPRETPYADRFGQPWRLGDGVWGHSDVVLVSPPRAAHSIWLFFDPARTHRGWYVNLQEPLRRTAVGFDSVDHVLDLWIEPDGKWAWKDEDELQAAVEVGRFTPEEAAAIRAKGERVVCEWPIPTGLEAWRPDPAWPIPQLPAGWERFS